MHAARCFCVSLLVALPVAGCHDPLPPDRPQALAQSLSDQPSASAIANIYAADFVATAALGIAMNDSGDVVGTSYRDVGCGPFCLPPLETVVWRGTTRTVLPPVPGFSDMLVTDINNKRWVVGLGGVVGTATRAALWRPAGTGYSVTNLGTLPGTSSSEATGVDDRGRVVGWAQSFGFPFNGAPFRWTVAGGLVDLSSRGFPDEKPLAISPNGTVATAGFWYRLGAPASVVPIPPPPNGFMPPGTFPTAINDAGDQARFLVAASAGRLLYLFRFHRTGVWQQISNVGTGDLTVYGMGSITPAKDITATIHSMGVAAPGPNGQAQPLATRLSPAYRGADVTRAEDMSVTGQILAHVMIGRSERVVRLVPASPCAGHCIRVTRIAMMGKFVQDPSNPGRCTQNGPAHNRVTATVTVTSETGARLGGVTVHGRFLDDYWTDRPVVATTNAQGVVQFTIVGPCGVGAVAFLVDRAMASGRTLDRTTGVLTAFVIPQ
jgi:hypothetical protein